MSEVQHCSAQHNGAFLLLNGGAFSTSDAWTAPNSTWACGAEHNSLAGVSSHGPWWVTSSVTSNELSSPASRVARRSSRKQPARRGDGGGQHPGLPPASDDDNGCMCGDMIDMFYQPVHMASAREGYHKRRARKRFVGVGESTVGESTIESAITATYIMLLYCVHLNGVPWTFHRMTTRTTGSVVCVLWGISIDT